MKFSVMTLFPELFQGFMESSIIGRAVKKGTITIDVHNFRDFSENKHGKVDDTPYGGGSGMVISPTPLVNCLSHIRSKDKNMSHNTKVIYMSPRGVTLTHELAEHLVKDGEHMVIVCGHYEGIDQRFIDKYVDAEISIGDYVLTGGELPAMVLIDALSRLRGDVLGNEESHKDESFSNGLLEYPHYTKPREFENMDIPDILLTGDHKKIEKWRFVKSLEVTARKRPDKFKLFVENKIKDDEIYKTFTKREKKEVNEVISSLIEMI